MFTLSLVGPDKLLLVKIIHNVDLQGLLFFVGAVLGLKAKASNRGDIKLAFFSGLAVSVTSLFIRALPDSSSVSSAVATVGIFLSIIFYVAFILLVVSSYKAFMADH